MLAFYCDVSFSEISWIYPDLSIILTQLRLAGSWLVGSYMVRPVLQD